MTPAEFDAACRELLRRCPELSETSAGDPPSEMPRLGATPTPSTYWGWPATWSGRGFTTLSSTLASSASGSFCMIRAPAYTFMCRGSPWRSADLVGREIWRFA